MNCVDVTNQRELDEAAARGECAHYAGSATVSAYGSATVSAYGSATVSAYDSATVRAYDSATVRANGSATVSAYDSATVPAYGSATVYANGSATVSAYDSATVRAYDSATVRANGSATVRAYDSATVYANGSATVRAYDSATVYANGSATVSAYDSATVRAYDSATVRANGSATVSAYGSATISAYDSATISASKFVAIHRHGDRITVTEGTTATIIDVPTCDVLDEWVDYHGIERLDGGRLVLFKGVGDDLASANRLPDGTPCVYAPGTVVETPDWEPHDGCGNGLHLSPTPHHTIRYADQATRWVACAVDPADTVVITSFGEVPDKVKSRTCEVLYEVDIDGARVDVAVTA